MEHLYLSRLSLDLRQHQVLRDLQDPFELHRTVLNAFDCARRDAGVLHRLETHPHLGFPLLLIQSHRNPDWTFLKRSHYILPSNHVDNWNTLAVKTFRPCFSEGQVLRFRIRANPTLKKARDGRHSNRVPLLTRPQQEAWLERRAKLNGFELVNVEVSDSRTETASARPAGSCRTITLYSVQYDGLLRVEEPTRLFAAVRDGVGPSKAFGCGLLSLIPA